MSKIIRLCVALVSVRNQPQQQTDLMLLTPQQEAINHGMNDQASNGSGASQLSKNLGIKK